MGKISKLNSPTFTQSDTTCGFEFWYSVYGEVGNLFVVTQSGSNVREYWQTKITGSDSTWNYAQINLQSCLKDFTVRKLKKVLLTTKLFISCSKWVY